MLVQEQGRGEFLQLNVINQLIRETAVLRAELLTKIEQLNQATGRYQSTLGRALRLLDDGRRALDDQWRRWTTPQAPEAKPPADRREPPDLW